MKKAIVAIVLVGLLGAAAFFGWKFYSKVKVENIEALDAIPDNAAFILKFSEAIDFLQHELNSEESILIPLHNVSAVQRFASETDSLIRDMETTVPALYSYISGAELYYSVHMTGHNKFNALWTFQLAPPVDAEALQSSLQSLGTLQERDFEGERIWELTLSANGAKLHITHKGNILCISTRAVLTEKVVYTLNAEKHSTSDPLYQKLQKAEGQESRVSCFVNYTFFYRFIAQYGDPQYRELLRSVSELAQLAVFDVEQSPSLISMSGFSIASDTVPVVINSLQDCEPGTFDAASILPANLAGFFYFGAKDYKVYLEGMRSANWQLGNPQQNEKVNALLEQPVDDYFHPWMRDELIVAYGKSSPEKLAENTFAFMKVTDIKEATQALSELSATLYEKAGQQPDTFFYRTYQITHIPQAYLLSGLFGELFEPLRNTYFVALDQHIVFGNSVGALQNYLNDYMVGKSLAGNPHFKSVVENISNEAHLMCYLDVSVYQRLWSDYLAPEAVQLLEDMKLPLRAYGAFVFEVLAGANASYTNLLLGAAADEFQEEEAGWQAALDAKVAWGPHEVKNHQSGQTDVLVADVQNFLYRIDHRGQIAWKIPLIGKPLGNITSIDYYNNNKYQYLFNTQKFIYLLDINGNKVENYPVKLPKSATAGLSLISYEGSDKVRILLPLDDNKVYNFQLDGTETKGWMYPGLGAPVHQPVQYFSLDGKDILLIADTSGNVMYANRKGENRINTRLGFTNNTGSDFYQVMDGGENKLLTTDPLGRVIMINFKGEVSKLTLDEFSPTHQFRYFDYDLDGVKDYVFVDYQKIRVYKANRELLLSADLDFVPAPDGIRLQNAADSVLCMLKNSQNGQLGFLSLNTHYAPSESYVSKGNYFFSKATNAERLRLLTVNENVISNYLL